MDRLLPQIQAFCKETFDWVRKSDVTLVPAPGMIPEGVGFPFIGIKDGAVGIHHDLTGNVQEQDLVVDIYIYDRLGQAETNIKGLHEKVRDVCEKLTDQVFTGGILSAVPTTLMPVDLLLTHKKGLVIRRGLRFKYGREE
ncbi:hypothetical protein [Desulfobacter vibrioformis]|uniref:hypothetical protein n=1 Tax=Desulfobacter vibrioformis TaxID=34031 RepID=UPI00055258C6|nr:hypothetical protein [Desulfobacter vibrioformis]